MVQPSSAFFCYRAHVDRQQPLALRRLKHGHVAGISRPSSVFNRGNVVCENGSDTPVGIWENALCFVMEQEITSLEFEGTPQTVEHAQSQDLAEEAKQPTTMTVKVGFDILDLASREQVLGPFPEEFVEMARLVSINQANELFAEGGRGEAARRIMSRECALRRVILRQSELFLANILNNFRKDRAYDAKRLLAAEKVVAGEHRRFLNSMELYARLTMPINPTVHVSSTNTQMVFNGDNHG